MIGEQFGDYEILNALKSGGMGDVLLARRRGPAGFEQLCAIKTVRAELAVTPLARAMFLDEARLLARLSHPAIAQIIDFGERDGVAYMVMEYVPGMSFRGLGDKRPPAAVLCQAMAEACRGLHAAHELRDLVDGHRLGVVHRDISPDNLMLGYDARVKVLDFGIALVRGRQAPVTEFGTLKGKPPYMSPEQIKNLPLDQRSDVFSMAVVLWELLVGQPLFAGESIYAVARAVEHQAIVPPSSLVAGVPDGLDDVVLAGLARDPDQRLATAAAMAEVLERVAAAASRVSLEAWAETELATEREHHRRWLASVLAGGRIPTALGRPSDVRTAVEVPRPAALDEPAAATAGLREPSEPRVTETSEPSLLIERPRRRGARWLIAIAALGATAVGGWQLWPRGAGPAAVVARPDAAVVDASVIDAAIATVDALAIDGALDPAIDARDGRDGGRVTVDARRALDAGVTAPPVLIDAAPVAVVVDAAVGFGALAIGTWSPAARVTVDGDDWGETPVLPRKLSAGPHRVVLRSPIDRSIVYQITVTVDVGKTSRLAPPP